MTDARMSMDLPGLDLGSLAAWLRDALPGEITAGLRGHVIAGGRSNLTYEVTDGARTWVVRRPPLGHVLDTAHDMSREYRVISALSGTAVPVPETYALCMDAGVTGAPFFLMEMVQGTPYRFAAELEVLGAPRTRAIVDRMVETLAALHTVDPQAVGLGDFGRPQGFLGRQVRRWKRQLDSSRSRNVAGIDELRRRLAANPPESGATSIVHGDYRLDNILIDDQDEPAAILDWEMATLADPLTDVALLIVYQRLGQLHAGRAVTDVGRAAGYPSEHEVLDHYASITGRDLSDLGYHLALASYKLAVILEGVHYRHVQGHTVGTGFELVGALVEPIVEAGLTSIKEHI